MMAGHYDSRISIWWGVDPLAEKYYSISSYAYVANNPLIFIDPDGRTIVPVHGTWAANVTWKYLEGIQGASIKFFGDNIRGASFEWSGGNYASRRTEAALGLIDHLKTQMLSESFNGKITLVGHSHGGNVSIEALNMMADMEEFNGIELNLLTINTPVRNDYQLSKNAADRVNHVNIYDPRDPVQANGGNAVIISPKETDFWGNELNIDKYPVGKGWGEYGPANRTYKNASNIKVNNPQGIVNGNIMGIYPGDFHNSHNRVNDWINNKPDQK